MKAERFAMQNLLYFNCFYALFLIAAYILDMQRGNSLLCVNSPKNNIRDENNSIDN